MTERPFIPDAETMAAWAREEAQSPTPPSEDDLLKEALILQNFEDKFVQPDPTDHLTDDELWEMMPESIRRNQWTEPKRSRASSRSSSLD